MIMALLGALLTILEITVAFQDLEWKQRSRLAAALNNPNSPFKFDRSYTTATRNRYLNIQPWDNSRVRLKNPIGGSDYINASPIKLRTPRKTRRARSSSSASVAAVQDYNYIATQGPKEGQFSHFWHMVMQETKGPVGVIVMLTLCYEANKEKCGQYFPADADHPIFLAPERIHNEAAKPPDDGDPFIDSPRSSAGTDTSYSDTTSSPPSEGTSATDPDEEQAPEPETAAGSVELVSIQNDDSVGAEVRELKLTIGGQTKTIYHYLYSHWPDFGKPENEERAALMQLMKVSKQVAGESPRVVHCSAGVGRTGTFIALDFLISELEAGRLARRASESNSSSDDYFEYNRRSGMDSGSRSQSKEKTTTPELPQGETVQGKEKETDLIKDTVDLLRQQRMMMVMNELQFTLLYDVIRDAFVHMYAEKEVGAVVTGTADVDTEGPSPKIARTISAQMKDGGSMYDGTKVGTVKGDEDTISDQEGGHSEAETEIEGAETGLTQDIKTQMSMGGEEDEDPYAAVAPERIREGIRGKRVEGGYRDAK